MNVILEDASSNGTYYNGEKVSQVMINKWEDNCGIG